MTIKAIETRYKGYRFRSRLEARWAVFFDALGVKWEYELEGFDLHEQCHQVIETFNVSKKKEFGEWTDHELHVHSYWSDGEIKLLEELLRSKKAYYLPDFHIPSLGFIEIKPYQGYSFWGQGFVLPKLQGALLLHGSPGTQDDQCYELCTFYDVPYFLGYCPNCKTFGYGFMGWAERICKNYEVCGHYRKDYLSESKDMLNAIIAARSARFEHGETPRL